MKQKTFENYAHSEKILGSLQNFTGLMTLEKQRVPLKVFIEPQQEGIVMDVPLKGLDHWNWSSSQIRH